MFTLYSNWEIRDFDEAQETCKRLSKFPVEMLTALLKTTRNYLKKKTCIKNPTYFKKTPHITENHYASRKVPWTIK